MASEERKKEILKVLYDGVVEFDEDKVEEYSKVALDETVDAYEAIMDGLAAGMEHVGSCAPTRSTSCRRCCCVPTACTRGWTSCGPM